MPEAVDGCVDRTPPTSLPARAPPDARLPHGSAWSRRAMISARLTRHWPLVLAPGFQAVEMAEVALVLRPAVGHPQVPRDFGQAHRFVHHDGFARLEQHAAARLGHAFVGR